MEQLDEKIKINGISLTAIKIYTLFRTCAVIENFFKEYPDKAIDKEGYANMKQFVIDDVEIELMKGNRERKTRR